MYLLWLVLGVYYAKKVLIGIFILNGADLEVFLLILTCAVILPSMFFYNKYKKPVVLILGLSLLINLSLALLYDRTRTDWVRYFISYILPLSVLIVMGWYGYKAKKE
jgi:hypothetical protein